MKFFRYDKNRKRSNIIIEHIAIMIPCFAIIGASFFFSTSSLENRTGLGKVVPQCMFKKITGIPCPSCGMSRAFCSISRGKFKDALRYNPLSVPLYTFFLGLGTISALSLCVFVFNYSENTLAS